MIPAHRHDGSVGLALVRGMSPLEDGKAALLLADAAYDTEALFQSAEERGLLLLARPNRRRECPEGSEGGLTRGGLSAMPTVIYFLVGQCKARFQMGNPLGFQQAEIPSHKRHL